MLTSAGELRARLNTRVKRRSRPNLRAAALRISAPPPGRQPRRPAMSAAERLSPSRTPKPKSKDPFWRNIRPINKHEESRLEGSWDDRHHMHFSKMNQLVQPRCRDYFDRPRHLAFEIAGLPPKVSWKPSWSLKGGHRIPDRPFYGFRSVEDQNDSESVQKRAGWNDRHSRTQSEANPGYHDSDKEYFGRYLNASNEMVVQAGAKGITRLSLPFHDRGNPDGRDSSPGAAEIALDGAGGFITRSDGRRTPRMGLGAQARSASGPLRSSGESLSRSGSGGQLRRLPLGASASAADLRPVEDS